MLLGTAEQLWETRPKQKLPAINGSWEDVIKASVSENPAPKSKIKNTMAYLTNEIDARAAISNATRKGEIKMLPKIANAELEALARKKAKSLGLDLGVRNIPADANTQTPNLTGYSFYE